MYYLLTQIYYGLIRLAAFWSPKAKMAIRGRIEQGEQFEKMDFEKGRWIWVHCASLGEFEQGRPLIEAIKNEMPEFKILLTFFSPSGYEIRKNYPFADAVFYLPFDSPGNARWFLGKVKPVMAIFVKYEFWHFYLSELQKRNISTYLVSAVFRRNQVFFKWYGSFFRKLLRCFRHIFVQNQISLDLLHQVGMDHASLAGDTRVDRVAAEAKNPKSLPEVFRFCQDKKVLICGSTWLPDEAILLPFLETQLPPDWKVIIAPHEIGEAHLENLRAGIRQSMIRFSDLKKENPEQAKILLVDNIGNLSSLYQFGTLAYIGGGFGAGIHNTLEPIAFGLPVIFGPKYQKFEEAKYLVESGGGFSIKNGQDLETIFSKMLDSKFYTNSSKMAGAYIRENGGATQSILKFLKQNFH